MFNKNNFCHIASNNRNEKKAGVFVYKTTDNLETVATSGYFNDKIVDINLHDLIIHEWHNPADRTKVQRNVLCVIERTLDNVGTIVIKSKWQGDIEQALDDLKTYIDENFVNIDGTSIMTGPLKFSAGSMRGAIAGGFNGLTFFKIDSEGNMTQIGSLSDTQFVPAADNTLDIGTNLRKVERIYLGKVNNGYDIDVPVTNSADTLALKSQVDDAANSGEQLYATGVWYAKMYAGTTPPAEAEVEGRNYADFSQVDQDNNPIIVVYTYTSGAWTTTATITPPKNHNGYMTITSKIWDIAEQTGQQGGLVLWSHNQKTFTPYPRIISFENAALTGVSTAPTPTASSPDDQIANKKYVDGAVAGAHYHPDLFDVKWADHLLNDISWLRADTFSWQDGGVYEAAHDHLADDCEVAYAYRNSDSTVCWLRTNNPQVGDLVYNNWQYTTSPVSSIVAYDESTQTITLAGDWPSGEPKTFTRFPYSDKLGHMSSETVSGVTIQFYLADDGHKICPASEESKIEQLYQATGVAWYYILDTTNQRFKLPRTKFGFNGLRDTVGKYVAPGLPNITGEFKAGANIMSASGAFARVNTSSGENSGGGSTSYAGVDIDASRSSSIYGNSTTVQPPATQMYLYFYVGGFSQTALENTAGLNAELFNNKVDLDAQNLSAAGKEQVAHLGMPSATYLDVTVNSSGTQYTAPADGYYSVHAGSTANGGYIELVSDTKPEFGNSSSAQNGVVLRTFIPVTKGEIIRLWYSNVSFFHFRFYYANGAV